MQIGEHADSRQSERPVFSYKSPPLVPGLRKASLLRPLLATVTTTSLSPMSSVSGLYIHLYMKLALILALGLVVATLSNAQTLDPEHCVRRCIPQVGDVCDVYAISLLYTPRNWTAS